MATASLRVLALVTDAFGGQGGIAQYNRDFLSALAACDRIGEVIVLPRACAGPPGVFPSGLRQLPAVQGRLGYTLAALAAARSHRPIDAVFCGHIYMVPLAAAVGKLLNARLWVQVHGIEAWRELSHLYRYSLEAADLVTAVSRFTRRRLLEWAAIDPVRVKVLPNTVDPRFRPEHRPTRLQDRYQAWGKKVLVTVSRLASSEGYKGHDRVIRALPRVLAEYPETIYVIVGDGDDRPRLEALASEAGVRDRLHFSGMVSGEELPDYYRMADVFVMPSTGEGFGIAFLEAMACGVDVIGGNRDGSVDPLADGKLGAIIDPENGDELAAAICAALEGPMHGHSLAERFKAERFAGHLQALVQTDIDMFASRSKTVQS
jgi:phosphatidyl-myo-inositol dimannoside synthase